MDGQLAQGVGLTDRAVCPGSPAAVSWAVAMRHIVFTPVIVGGATLGLAGLRCWAVQVQRLRHPGFEGCEVRAQRARRVLLGRQPVLRRRACTKFIFYCIQNSGGSDCGHLAFWLRILVELVVVEV